MGTNGLPIIHNYMCRRPAITACEKAKPRQHPIGNAVLGHMTEDGTVYNLDADWNVSGIARREWIFVGCA